MKDLKTVIAFSIKDMVKRKSFIISTLIILVLIVIGINIPNILKAITGDNENAGETKILIVDDNKLNIKVAKKALQPYEVIIDECYNGEECLKKVKENQYDVILMDIMMPVMSGTTTLKKLQEEEKQIPPVIAVTADAIAGAQERYLKEGFVDYIAKPFTKKQIKEKLDKVLGKEEDKVELL